MTYITIPAKDGGNFKAYIAMPDTTPAPAVIVIQEIFGINNVMREKCDWLATQGYIAICPDLFWRIEPGIELTDQTDAEWARAFELFQAFDVDKGIEDLRAAKHTMRGHADCTGKVGCLGYCLGGKLAYLMAARSKIDTSIGYYGVGIQDLLDEATNIEKPLLLHIAEKDEYTDAQAQEKIKSILSGNNHVTIYSYPGMDHAFSRPGGVHYDKAAATLADERSLNFLKDNL